VRRVLADEGVGFVDRGLLLVLAVVGVDQVEAALACRVAERKARGQRLEGLDRGVIAAGIELRLARW